MAVHTAVETALYEALTAAPGASIWGDRVYCGLAELLTQRPYVVFAYVAGGIRTECRRDNLDVDYRIECIADSNGDALAGADAIEAALHRTKISITGWASIFVRSRGMFSFPELVDGRMIHRRGAIYRILASEVG